MGARRGARSGPASGRSAPSIRPRTPSGADPMNPVKITQHTKFLTGPLAPSEQDHCRSQQFIPPHQTETAQYRFRIAGTGRPHPSAAYRFVHRLDDLGMIEIGHGPTGSRFVFPAPLPVKPLEEHPVGFVFRQGNVHRTHPAPRSPSIPIRRAETSRSRYRDHEAPLTDLDTLDLWEHRRINPLQMLRELLLRVTTDLLPLHCSIGRHADEHPSSAVVQHRAGRLRHFAALSGRRLELLGLGFAGGYPIGEVCRDQGLRTRFRAGATDVTAWRAGATGWGREPTSLRRASRRCARNAGCSGAQAAPCGSRR